MRHFVDEEYAVIYDIVRENENEREGFPMRHSVVRVDMTIGR